jgi:peptidoglycan/xylan/chitin deacetylase (PgdA/CDA1 family)
MSDSEPTPPARRDSPFAATRATLRRGLKHAAVEFLSLGWRISGRQDKALARPRVQIAVLHHVEIEMRPAFAAWLRELSKFCTFVTYSQAVERAIRGPIDKPMLAFSFDDGFRSCIGAAEVMRDFGATACHFVNPRIVGERDPEVIRAWRTRLRLRHNDGHMDWDDLATLIDLGHEIGNHSMDHQNLGLPSVDLTEQIVRSKEVITQKLGIARPHFAWPYGSVPRLSLGAKRTVYESGHASCASSLRGAHIEPAGSTERLCLRRDHTWFRLPVHHNLVLLARSAQRAGLSDNHWPPPLAD